jgi:gentisate 1,2-dioxygenase
MEIKAIYSCRNPLSGVNWREPSTRIGRIATANEPATGFHVQTIAKLFAEIPPGKRSGAHRHSYEETEYVISGNGYSIVEDQRVDWKEGDTLCIPVFSWHQHFNTGKQTARFMVHHNRPYIQNMGFLWWNMVRMPTHKHQMKNSSFH